MIDTTAPFLDADYALARAVAGRHWIDLADGRRFVAGFAEALQACALGGGVMALTGSLVFTFHGSRFTYGAFLTEVLSFAISAAVVYFVVVVPVSRGP